LFGTPSAGDFVSRIEKVVQGAIDQAQVVGESVVKEMFPRPVGSVKVSDDDDFNEWLDEEAERADETRYRQRKQDWLKGKASIYGNPVAVSMFLKRENKHEKRLTQIPIGDGFMNLETLDGPI
jgi:hypothetical protein